MTSDGTQARRSEIALTSNSTTSPAQIVRRCRSSIHRDLGARPAGIAFTRSSLAPIARSGAAIADGVNAQKPMPLRIRRHGLRGGLPQPTSLIDEPAWSCELKSVREAAPAVHSKQLLTLHPSDAPAASDCCIEFRRRDRSKKALAAGIVNNLDRSRHRSSA